MVYEEDVEFLEHFGVKGQKWGVRNESRLQRAKSVADGTASKMDKVRFVSSDTSSRVIKRTGSVQAAAKLRENQLQARKDRVTTGKGTTKDFLALHGGDRFMPSIKLNGVKVDKAKRAEKTSDGRKIATTILAGAAVGLTVASIASRSTRAQAIKSL